jgi:hypothetical protein
MGYSLTIEQLSTSLAMHHRADVDTRCIYMHACYLDTFMFIICSITRSSGIFSGSWSDSSFWTLGLGLHSERGVRVWGRMIEASMTLDDAISV